MSVSLLCINLKAYLEFLYISNMVKDSFLKRPRVKFYFCRYNHGSLFFFSRKPAIRWEMVTGCDTRLFKTKECIWFTPILFHNTASPWQLKNYSPEMLQTMWGALLKFIEHEHKHWTQCVRGKINGMKCVLSDYYTLDYNNNVGYIFTYV